MASGIANVDPATAPGTAPDAGSVVHPDRTAPGSLTTVKAAVEALRPYQWVKNLLLFLPLILAHEWRDVGKIGHVVLGFIAFSLAASSAYVLNDLHDLDADRHHPKKRNRPFASGRLSGRAGAVLAMAALLAAFAVSVSLLLPKFSAMLGLYVILTLAYSFFLKQRLLVDVFLLAGLYTHRVLAGGTAIDVTVTPWLLAFCIFFFLSLAYAKRYAELRRVQNEVAAGGAAAAVTTVRGRAYQVEDMEVVATVGPTSGYMAVLVLALYVNSSTAISLYRQPFLLWLVCPLLLYWQTRVWFLARRGSMSEDPLMFALKDRMSLAIAGLTGLLVVLATVWPSWLSF